MLKTSLAVISFDNRGLVAECNCVSGERTAKQSVIPPFKPDIFRQAAMIWSFYVAGSG